MWIVEGYEEISDSELQRRIALLNTLSLQEGYTQEMKESDARFIGICDNCFKAAAIRKTNCDWCTRDLRGEL